MSVQAIVPFRPVNPKTRLSCVMDQQEREAFARVMLDDVIQVLISAGCKVSILCTEHYPHPSASTIVSEKGLNEALNDTLSSFSGSPVLIFMADLPLVTREAVDKVLSSNCDCVLVPGRGGGTNSILLRDPARFRVDFYGASFCDHLRIAQDAGFSVEAVDSYRLSTDVDEKEDLVEVLLHGMGASRTFLEGIGISLSLEKGRVSLHRDSHEEAF